MLNQIADWLDNRTGYRTFLQNTLERRQPGGARWRYVFGSSLTLLFVAEFATGLLMMSAYSPSASTAWGSVFYINNQMWMGWMIRGIHHFASQAIVILLTLHLLQTLLGKAYRSPREFTWWFGLILIALSLGIIMTGDRISWDQNAYFATKVAANILGSTPVLGPYLQTIVVGGTDYGNQTVTRFYALHAAVLPGLLVIVLLAHIAMFRRYGITPPADHERYETGKYWPQQAFYNVAFSTVVFLIIVGIVVWQGGAQLDAPADPSISDYPARPEWYFLPLYEMRKMFLGKQEVIGTMVIPGAISFVLVILPFLDWFLPKKLAHFLATGFVFTLVGGAGYLTVQAMRADANDHHFLEAREKADLLRDRALYLAGHPDVGVPPSGPMFILRRDPLTQGRSVLEKKCLGCHFFDGKGAGAQTAPDLKDFGTKDWILGLLKDPSSPRFFGKNEALSGMKEWKQSSKLTPKELEDVADFVASFARIPADVTPEEWLNQKGVTEHPGVAPFQKECGKCHSVDELPEAEGGERDSPKLFAWGSPQWIERMIRKPAAPDKYGYLEAKDQMPAFGADQMVQSDVEMIIRYLRNDYIPEATTAKAPAPGH